MAQGRLQEVEEDAIYIQTKRFNEQFEELARAKEKQARDEAKKTELSVDKKGNK